MAKMTVHVQDWWKQLSYEEQLDYLSRHPGSDMQPTRETVAVDEKDVAEEDLDAFAKQTEEALDDIEEELDDTDKRKVNSLLKKAMKAGKESALHYAKAGAILATKAAFVGTIVAIGGAPLLMSFPQFTANVLSTAEKTEDTAEWLFAELRKTLKNRKKLRRHYAKSAIRKD